MSARIRPSRFSGFAGGFGGVASGEGDVVLGGEGLQAVEEAFDPGAALRFGEQAGGQREGEEGGERGCAHGGEVAESAGEAAVAD